MSEEAVNADSAGPTALVSVIVPTFNYAQYVGDCIRSVMQQTFTDVEIIVVDDGSTDDTEAVIAALNAPRLRYVRHEKNRGQAAARNTGMEIARGEYVSFLDADDSMRRDNLSKKVEILERYPNVALVHSAVESVDEHGNPVLRRTSTRKNGDVRVERLFPNILYGNSIVHSSVLARRKAIDEVGGWDPELRYADDWDLWLRLSRRYEFAYIGEQLVRKRVHQGSIEWRGYLTHQDLQEAEEVLRKAFATLPLEDEGFDFRKLYWEHYYRKLNNKAELLPFLAFARLYARGVRNDPRGALRPPGIKAAVKLVASGLLPRRFIQRLRFQRAARQVGDTGQAAIARVPMKLRTSRTAREPGERVRP